MSGRWTVRREFGDDGWWMAWGASALTIYDRSFPTWREAFDYADRMARADR